MDIRRCMRCMHELQLGEKVCPKCGRERGKEAAEPFVLRPGSLLDGRYVVGEMLGRSEAAITYIGVDLWLEQKVAVREYFPAGAASRENQTTVVWSGAEKGLRVFQKEAQNMAGFGELPGAADVKAVLTQNGTAYAVMRFVEGETLRAKIEREGAMPFGRCVEMLTPVIQALGKAHQNGIIHGDIGPDQIMITESGEAVLLNLGAGEDPELTGSDGIARPSAQFTAKHGFSPLEQYIANGKVGSWTDVYAMCATIYYCCTGKVPQHAAERMLEDELTCQPLLKPKEFRALAKGLGVKPADRLQTMDALMETLRGEASGADGKREAEVAAREPEDRGQTAAAKPGTEKKSSRKTQIFAALALCLVLAVAGICVRMRSPLPQTTDAISAGRYHTVGLKSDGTVVAVGGNGYGLCDVGGWRDIVAVRGGEWHTVGLKLDGTVVAAGSNGCGQCDVGGWRDIVAVSTGDTRTVGLKSNGTVVAVGSNGFGQCNVSEWRDIVAISAGERHTVGLKSDGTVMAVGSNVSGQCDVSEWRDIVAISIGYEHTVGLKSDGMVVAVGKDSEGQCDVSEWRDIVAISAGDWHTVGLKSDGTVVAVGGNRYGQCDVSGWSGIGIPQR